MNLQMARGIFVIVFTGLLTGCATAPSSPVVTRVEIPVDRECLPDDVPERPEVSSDDALRALPNAEYVITVSAERQVLRAYAAEAEAAIKGCR